MRNLTNISEISGFIWGIADSVLRGAYKRNEYQKVILPFTVLKRFDSVLEYSKKDVVDTYEANKDKIEFIDPILNAKAVDENGEELGFYNYSRFDFKTLLQDPDNIEENIKFYIESFSKNVKDILENFDIEKQIAKLSKANNLYLLIKKFNETNLGLSPKNISNHDMGTIFEELIRKFSETSNEEAGEHFTPRDVVKLMTELLFVGEEQTSGSIKLVYDPACGTGGMLTSCKEFITKSNPDMDVVLYGQEINDEIYAICKADMLMKGEEADYIKGPSSTLSDDQLSSNKFDYMISNPPYGRDWEQDKEIVTKEAEEDGFDGRFGAGLPRKSDGQLLFIQHMISKMKDNGKSRIAVITNGSPLFTGDAGSGESNIRKWIFENDYLEALIALPDQLFFNTGIGTYVWVLTNEKTPQREGKVQLIDAREEYTGMRKSLGSKRHTITNESIDKIIDTYKDFSEGDNVKIFYNEDFGYTKITVERPMQLNYQVTPERLENLYSYSAFKKLAESKSKDLETKIAEEEKGKKQQEAIKEALLTIGDDLYTDWDTFETKVKQALNQFDLKPAFIKNVIEKLSEHDDTAEYVTDKKGKPKADSNLRDTEKIPLVQNIDDYFEDEVLKYYSDAWFEDKKNKIGYEINFTQYFYVYEQPRPLEEIEADINKVTAEIQELLK
ncbi:class I SAM-dependent DNA methyltransferase [Methanobrevibacter sp.]|uniref:type I restriction-modification system subunit M n=1 Tax=Methanobrevibacter sp. TaxID=66852 RepID=UPI0025D782CC|nr:class I SAM-dependent DNA methyltransferase [Methanobrevibacter sp.]